MSREGPCRVPLRWQVVRSKGRRRTAKRASFRGAVTPRNCPGAAPPARESGLFGVGYLWLEASSVLSTVPRPRALRFFQLPLW